MIKLLSWLGIDVAGFNSLRPEFSAPSFIYIVLFILLCSAAAWWAWSSTKLLDSKKRRTILASLRVSALALLFITLLDPAMVLEQRNPIRPRAAIIWDSSLSMTISGSNGLSRIDEARKWWSNAKPLRVRLEKEYRPEVWTFSENAAIAAPETFSAGLQNSPDGERTDILEALKRVSRGESEAPAAVILISDGADNSALGEAAKKADGVESALKDYPSPVYVVPLGVGEKNKDIGIEEVELPEYGFVRNAVEIKLTIAARGFMGTEVPVSLLDGERVVTTRSFKVDSDDGTWSVDLAFTPDQVGEFLYKITIPQFEGEAVYDNNTRIVSLNILRDKIRVLHVVGRPSWDTRYLREALKKDPTIELISFYIIREPQDDPRAMTEELSLIPFPTDELFDTKIRTFDLIIFHNFPWVPYLRPAYLMNIRDFVTEFGGGFAMIGGPLSFSGGYYAGTEMEGLLPVELAKEGAIFQEGEYQPRLTEAGSRHPITAMEASPEETKTLWDSMPPLEGFCITGPAKAGATVLMEHPFQTAGGSNMPILATWSVGRGKVMSFASDTSYRWRLESMVQGRAGEEYIKFWRAAVRWLSGDPEGKRVRVRTDRTRYAPNQSISVRVKALDFNYAPAPQSTLEAVIEGAGQSSIPIPQKAFALDGEERVAEVKNPGPGGWTVKIKAFNQQQQELGDDSAVFVVERKGLEFSPPWPNPDLMTRIAASTGGEVWDSKQSPEAGKMNKPDAWRVVGRRRVPLWDNWAAGGLLLIALAGEWYFRRRWGLN